MAQARKQTSAGSTELILRAIDKTIAEVAAQKGIGVPGRLEALHELRERVLAESLDDNRAEAATATASSRSSSPANSTTGR